MTDCRNCGAALPVSAPGGSFACPYCGVENSVARAPAQPIAPGAGAFAPAAAGQFGQAPPGFGSPPQSPPMQSAPMQGNFGAPPGNFGAPPGNFGAPPAPFGQPHNPQPSFGAPQPTPYGPPSFGTPHSLGQRGGMRVRKRGSCLGVIMVFVILGFVGVCVVTSMMMGGVSQGDGRFNRSGRTRMFD